MSTKGISDLPVDGTTDTLKIDDLISALTDYIAACETPLTISIQGAWGSGKTSAMNAIRHKLETGDSGGVWSVFFNTWQYSQFDLGEELSLSLIRTLLFTLESRIDEDRTKFEKARELVKKILNGLPTATLKMASELAVQARLMTTLISAAIPPAVPAALGATKAIETFSEEMGEAVADRNAPNERILLVDTLKKDFGDLVEAVCTGETDAPKRIVVFIDDLDRLSPVRAVELLEAIKIFLDVRHCVFVLAIDFDVVRQGVDEKFGKSLGDEKARAFFDKIIQVPFNLPVGRYDIATILGSAVDSSEKFVGLIDDSIGRNPRAVKRLVNQFILLRDIALTAGRMLSLQDEIDIFSFLCFEAGFPWVYRDFEERMRHTGSDSALTYFFGEIEALEDNALGELTRSLWRIADAYSAFRLLRFSKRIAELFSEDIASEQRGRRLDLVLQYLAFTISDSGVAKGERSASIENVSAKERRANLKRRSFIAEAVQDVAAAFDAEIAQRLAGVLVESAALPTFSKWSYYLPNIENEYLKPGKGQGLGLRANHILDLRIFGNGLALRISAQICRWRRECGDLVTSLHDLNSDLKIDSDSDWIVVSGVRDKTVSRQLAILVAERVLARKDSV